MLNSSTPAPTSISRLLLPTLMLGVFMGALDLAIVAPAFSTLGREFRVDVRDLTWVFTIYVLANIASLPLMAKLSDSFGRRPVYVFDVALFSAGSALAALAPSYAVFLAARALQALGAGGIFPVASAVIGDVFPKGRQGLMFGLVASVWGIASIIGPPVGGIIVQHLSWHWIFLVNLPIGALVIVGALAVVPAVRHRRRGRFDIVGLVLLTGALISLTFGLSRLDGTRPWLGLFRLDTGVPMLLAALMMIPWVRVEMTASDPIVSLGLLRRRQIAVANGLTILAGFSQAAMFFLPAFASLLLGLDVQSAGLIITPGALALFLGAPAAGVLLDRIGTRAVVVLGGILAGIGMMLIGWWVHDVGSLILALVIGGMGLSGLLGTPIRFLVSRETAASERAVAMAVVSICTSTGTAIGSAVTGAVVSSTTGVPLAGYDRAYVMIGLVLFSAAALALLLKGRDAESPGRGAERPRASATIARGG